MSSNEDVFELIKFDILIQLVGKYKDQINLEKEDFSKFLLWQMFLRERFKYSSFLPTILSLFSQINKPAGEFLKAIKRMEIDFDKFSESVKVDENKVIEEYLRNIEESSGTAYEMDDISKLIESLLARLKTSSLEEGNSKENVLIIDDLDRLDPDHIFRLFNVFSAHFDDVELSSRHNKFGFDKVIFVCDIENIRKIYRHRYGANVDFKGYLDKFYTYMPFEFDNRRFVNNKLWNFMNAIHISSYSNSSDRFKKFIEPEGDAEFKQLFNWLLRVLVNARVLNLRTLNCLPNIHIPDIKKIIVNNQLRTSNYQILWVFHFLFLVYGSWEMVYEKLKILNELFLTNRSHKVGQDLERYDEIVFPTLISYCLPFIISEEIGFKRFKEQDDKTVAKSDLLNCNLHFDIIEDRNNSCVFFEFKKATKIQNNMSQDVIINPYDLMLKTFEKCWKSGYLEQ